ncbi:MAG: REP-associated tyrosine transposase [Candidatus Acidiferrales bacterium]
MKRRYGQGHLHFITCSCYRRLPLLGSVRSRNIFVQILAEVRDRYAFALVGYVVMPEHVHLLISEPAKGTPSTVLQVLKQRVSRSLGREPRGRRSPTQSGVRHGQPDQSLPQFWQPRFYDFNVWSQKKKVEKLQYMHMNPVKRELASQPKEWPWSSYSFYSTRSPGLVRIDPGN